MKLVAQKPEQAPDRKPAAPPQSSASSQRTLEVVKQAEEYTCSMHPDIRTTAPGKCPKCGEPILAQRACPKCGEYKGRAVQKGAEE